MFLLPVLAAKHVLLRADGRICHGIPDGDRLGPVDASEANLNIYHL
jgi:hypothetical protein